MRTTANHTNGRGDRSTGLRAFTSGQAARFDFQFFDLPGQRVAMDAEGISGFAQVAVAFLDYLDDKTAIEFAKGILVADAFVDHPGDKLVEQFMHAGPPKPRQRGTL